MQLFHFYHYHHSLRRLIHSDFWLFELSIWLHVTARSLITIFIPILLLQNGFSLNSVITYYFFFYAINVPLNFFAGWLIRKIGARWVIVLSNFAIISYFVGFGLLEGGNFLLLGVLALLAAIYDALYWVAHLYLFVKTIDHTKKDAGGKTGALYSAKQIATMIGPLAGALILAFSTQTVLISLSVVMFFISVIPLFFIDSFSDKPTKMDAVSSFFSFFKNPVEKNNFLSTGLFSLHQLGEFILWPLFIFLIFESINSVAIIPVLIAGTTIIFSVFNKKKNASTRERMIMLGAMAVALVWFARISIHWEPFYYISIVLVGIFSLFVSIPLDSNLFIRAQTTDPLKTVVYRNAVSMATKTAVFVALVFFSNIFQTSFIIIAISLLLIAVVNFYFLNEDKEYFDAI